MHRPRLMWCLIPVLVVLAFSVAGCGGSEHDQMIRRFFQASAMGDNVTLGNIATVSFDPAKDGRAQNVSFVSESPVRVKALRIKELDQRFKEAQAAAAAVSKDMKAYQDKNLEAINRVVKVEQTGQGRITGNDLAVQKAWTEWRDKSSVVERAASEARQALAAERRVADLSVPDKDVTAFDASEETTEVTVSANVQSPDKQTAKKTLVLTLQRVVLKDASGKPPIEGKWMITGIKAAGQ